MLNSLGTRAMCQCPPKNGVLQRSRPATVVLRRSSSGGAAASTWEDEPRRYDRLTDRLVFFSSIPFSVLVLPQVVRNFINISAGNAAALSVISWEGYLSALMGNTLMCSHFANRGERSAVNVQLIGMLNNFAVLCQVALFTSAMPKALFTGVAVLAATAVAMNVTRLRGGPVADAGGSMGTWRWWLLLTGIFGLAVVPQVMYGILVPHAPSSLPGLASAGLLTLYFLPNALRPGQARTVEALPGWASTLLFALSPLPQLVRNFVDPQSLEGLSVGTMLLALLGNALMVPRALLVRDLVWLLGCTWACVAGWGQLLSMFIRTSPSTGLRYLDPSLFVAVTAALVAYAVWLTSNDSRVKGKKLGESVFEILRGPPPDAKPKSA